MSLNVTIPDTFNGPLGLLHSLIVRDEIDIYDIPIAKLTASYCEEIEKMEVINIDEGAEFLDLASRLKDIKLRMLLPPEEGLDGEEDEDDGFEDPRAGLVEALLEFRRFRDVSRVLGELADEQSRRFPRVAPRMQFRLPEVDEDADNDSLNLFLAMQNMIARLVTPEIIESHEIPISTRIEQIKEVLDKREKTRFSLLLSTRPDRREMIAFFIAVLELVRRRLITARQADNFSDILIERRIQTSTPESRGGTRTRLRPGRCFPEACLPARRRETDGAGVRKNPFAFPCPVVGRGKKTDRVGRRGCPAPFPTAVPGRGRRA